MLSRLNIVIPKVCYSNKTLTNLDSNTNCVDGQKILIDLVDVFCTHSSIEKISKDRLKDLIKILTTTHKHINPRIADWYIRNNDDFNTLLEDLFGSRERVKEYLHCVLKMNQYFINVHCSGYSIVGAYFEHVGDIDDIDNTIDIINNFSGVTDFKKKHILPRMIFVKLFGDGSFNKALFLKFFENHVDDKDIYHLFFSAPFFINLPEFIDEMVMMVEDLGDDEDDCSTPIATLRTIVHNFLFVEASSARFVDAYVPGGDPFEERQKLAEEIKSLIVRYC